MSPGLTLADVLAATGGRLRGSASPELALSAVRHDSRSMQRGALFVALHGPKHDGHAFVAEAFARGASAALVERVPTEEIVADDGLGPPLVEVANTTTALRDLGRFWLDRQQAAITYVVGSIGRATTTELAAAVLRQRSGVVAAKAGAQPDVGVPLALLNLRPGVSQLVLDLGPCRPDETARALALAPPATLVVTNIEPTLHEGEATLDEVTSARAALVRAVPPGGTVILNDDDRRVRRLADQALAQPLTFGLAPTAAVRAESIVGHGILGTELEIVVADRGVRVRLPLLGLFSVHAALAATAAGLAEGLDLQAIGEGLQTASPAPRIVVATGLNGARIIDDSHNASPESDLEALNLLAELEGRKVAVLGDMLGLGLREEAGHRLIGNRAALVADDIVTVGERARVIADEARRMGLRGSIFEAGSAAEALDHLRRGLRPGDNVLVKGSPELRMHTIVQAIRLEG